MSSDTAAIEWTSATGIEYKAVHSEDCRLCDLSFGVEACLQSPPCRSEERSDGVPIAWVAKIHPLDIAIPEEDFPVPPNDDDEDDDSEGRTFYWEYQETKGKLNKLSAAARQLLSALDAQSECLIRQAKECVAEIIGESNEKTQ